MQAWEFDDLVDEGRRRGDSYMEFFRALPMSCGIYRLPRGAVDHQAPHSEDEMYYVAHGRAQIRVGAEDRAVRPGTLIFVPARVEHRFHSIEDDLDIVVFFAPAERLRAKARRVHTSRRHVQRA